MTIAGIELRYLVNEITKTIADYYVSNIYGITKDTLLFKLHHSVKPDVLLVLSTFGLWISSVKIDQIESNRLLKRLRQDLLRLKLTKIEQIGAERVAYLTFSGFDKEFVIVAELFGKGNIILCNKEMKILALLHSIDVRHRKLGVGSQYMAPPQQGLNVFDISQKDLEEIKTCTITSGKWVGRTLGFPQKYVDEIFRVAEINPKSLGKELSSQDVKSIYNTINEIVNQVVSGQHNPVLVHDADKSDVYPIKLGGSVQSYTNVSSFIEGLDRLLTEDIVNKGKSIKSNVTDKKIEESKSKLEEQTKAITLVKEKSEAISSIAKSVSGMVSQGILSIQEPTAIKVLAKQNSQIIKEKGISYITIPDEKIKINLDASLHAIASTLFDEAKKQSGAISSIEKLKKKTEKNILELEKKAQSTKESITFSQVRKKNWYERYRWFHTSDGFLAIGGRDSSSNSAVIRKHLEKNDIVFHADIYGSPFFILKDSKDPPPSTLNEIAHATVCFSRAWKENMYGLDAFWVNPEQVKKAAPSGQFLPKGAFSIDGQRNFVKISTLKLAVGLVNQNENYLLTCGPPIPIKKNCICYVIIESTGLEMVDAAKKIRTEFMKMKGEVVKPISIDDFVRVLPSGMSHIVESGLGDA